MSTRGMALKCVSGHSKTHGDTEGCKPVRSDLAVAAGRPRLVGHQLGAEPGGLPATSAQDIRMHLPDGQDSCRCTVALVTMVWSSFMRWSPSKLHPYGLTLTSSSVLLTDLAHTSWAQRDPAWPEHLQRVDNDDGSPARALGTSAQTRTCGPVAALLLPATTTPSPPDHGANSRADVLALTLRLLSA